MPQLPFPLVLALIAFFFAGSARAEREVWLAPRTDGLPGTGTLADPYDASTAGKFDARLRSFVDAQPPTPITIHLTAGTFLTEGLLVSSEAIPIPYSAAQYPFYFSAENSRGFYLYDGWKLIGAGKTQTTVRLATWPKLNGSSWPYSFAVIGSSDGSLGYWADHSEVRALTVDANWPALVALPPADRPPTVTALHAINLAGSNITVAEVAAINCYGHGIAENFTIYLTHPTTGGFLLQHGYPDNRLPGWDYLVERCECRDWRGTYGNGISVIPDYNGVGGRVRVLDNTVLGYYPATSALGVSGTDVEVTGNYVEGCALGYYVENGVAVNHRIHHNTFARCRYFGAVGLAGYPTLWQNILIDHNYIEVNGDAAYPWAVIVTDYTVPPPASPAENKASGIRIMGNSIVSRGPVPAGSGGLRGVAMGQVNDVLIEYNSLLSGFGNVFSGCTNVVSRGNRTETQATPAGLTDDGGAAPPDLLPLAYTYRFHAGESYGGFHLSHLVGAGTLVDLVAGAAGGPMDSFRSVTVATSSSGSAALASAVATIAGTAADLHVVQLSYSPAAAAALPGGEAGLVLGWLDGASWNNAVQGNATGLGTRVVGPFDGQLVAGRYGVDFAGQKVWAVVSHGGSFAAIAQSPFDTWRVSHFSPPELGLPAVSSATADADHDGAINLLEYSLARDPRSAEPSTPVSFALTLEPPHDLVLIYTRALAATDLTYSIWQTENFTTWAPASPTSEVVHEDALTQTIRATVPRAAADRQFLRLEITKP